MPSNYRRFFKKMQAPGARIVIGHLKKENAFLLKTLNELVRHHSEHNNIIQKFLSLETVRLEHYQKMACSSITSLVPEALSNHEEKLGDVVSMRRLSCYFKEIEEVKDKLVSISARCQYLESKVAKKQESNAEVQGSDTNVIELKIKLKDAIEKNKQWLDYDQQREAYVKSILARMLWLEKELNDINQDRAVERNDYQSSEKKKIKQVENYYDGLLQRANNELDVLREQVSLIQQALLEAQDECRNKQCEVEELKQQLHSEWRTSDSLDSQITGDDEARLKNESEELQGRLKKERRKSAALEIQSGLLQKYLLNHHHKAEEHIAMLERQIEISSQDLQDERANCTYLRDQLLKLLKRLPKDKEHAEKVDDLDQNSGGPSALPPRPPRNPQSVSPRSSLLEDSSLECPVCQEGYPVSHYRELLEHLELCLD